LNSVKADVIDIAVLIEHGIVRANTKCVKIIASGNLTQPVVVRGILVSAGARKMIEAVKGKVE
jgi:large subunit ribosomal protein L15